MRDQHLSIYSLSWRTTLLLQNHSTSLETIYKPTVYVTCTNLPNVKDLQRIPEVSKESQERKSSLLCMLLMANWNFIMQLHKTTFKVLYSDLPMTYFFIFSSFPTYFQGPKEADWKYGAEIMSAGVNNSRKTNVSNPFFSHYLLIIVLLRELSGISDLGVRPF